ncbi:hypothetical protein J28TS4_22250 [Paenibacillus lautus]|nr:hypothetical protein J28TS4_22250 [Paenibacillus lautus]
MRWSPACPTLNRIFSRFEQGGIKREKTNGIGDKRDKRTPEAIFKSALRAFVYSWVIANFEEPAKPALFYFNGSIVLQYVPFKEEDDGLNRNGCS